MAGAPGHGLHSNSAGPNRHGRTDEPMGDHLHEEIDHERFRVLRLPREKQVYLSPRENSIFVCGI
jgi:hypothetical protein